MSREVLNSTKDRKRELVITVIVVELKEISIELTFILNVCGDGQIIGGAQDKEIAHAVPFHKKL